MYPQMGGFWTHASGCDPKNYGEEQGGRPSAWVKENLASGTRVAADPKQRGKWVIQWKGWSSKDRVWKACPSDAELVSPHWIWKSMKEPTASVPKKSSTLEWLKPEVKEEEPEKKETETPAPRSKRSKKTQRQFQMRETYRVWVDTLEEAAVVK